MATKARGYTGLVYPDAENLPENWVEQLESSLGMWLISPLHEPDPVEDLETGAIKTKKPHYHVMYMHGNTVSPRAAKEIFGRYPWIVIPPKDQWFMVGSIRNLARYFCHLDQPEKQQWSEKPQDLLTVLNGFPLDLTRELTHADKLAMKQTLYSLMRDRSMTENSELINYLMDVGDWELFDFATDHPHMIQAYFWGVRKGNQKQAPPTDSEPEN